MALMMEKPLSYILNYSSVEKDPYQWTVLGLPYSLYTVWIEVGLLCIFWFSFLTDRLGLDQLRRSGCVEYVFLVYNAVLLSIAPIVKIITFLVSLTLFGVLYLFIISAFSTMINYCISSILLCALRFKEYKVTDCTKTADPVRMYISKYIVVHIIIIAYCIMGFFYYKTWWTDIHTPVFIFVSIIAFIPLIMTLRKGYSSLSLESNDITMIDRAAHEHRQLTYWRIFLDISHFLLTEMVIFIYFILALNKDVNSSGMMIIPCHIFPLAAWFLLLKQAAIVPFDIVRKIEVEEAKTEECAIETIMEKLVYVTILWYTTRDNDGQCASLIISEREQTDSSDFRHTFYSYRGSARNDAGFIARMRWYCRTFTKMIIKREITDEELVFVDVSCHLYENNNYSGTFLVEYLRYHFKDDFSKEPWIGVRANQKTDFYGSLSTDKTPANFDFAYVKDAREKVWIKYFQMINNQAIQPAPIGCMDWLRRKILCSS